MSELLNLDFEFPEFKPLDNRSVNAFQLAGDISTHETKSNTEAVTEYSLRALAKNIDRFQVINGSNPTIKESNIGGPHEAYIWHIDGSPGNNRSDKSVINLCSNLYPTEFAECNMTLTDKCIEVANSGTQAEIDNGEIDPYTSLDFDINRRGFEDVLFETFDNLTILFGINWLEKGAEGDKDIAEYVKVTSLAVTQALPFYLASGATERILHRIPSTPYSTNRFIFRSFFE